MSLRRDNSHFPLTSVQRKSTILLEMIWSESILVNILGANYAG
jgi:hypothetical protein